MSATRAGSRGPSVVAALALAAGALGCGTASRAASTGVVAREVARGTLPATRAERTRYAETSRYTDVVDFLDSLRALGAPLAFGSIGRTAEGREIPYVVASRPLVRTAAEARARGKPVVYVQGNIHAGEVEGKEALLALVRDLAFAGGRNALDSIVLVAVPIYNADGNERVGPQEQQRSAQNGPELVGQRPNALGLDLNRDYVKAEAPETRASLAMFAAWDPDVFVDLHTTDGSYHGYALTYSPSLNPAAPLGEYTRGLLAELRRRVRDRAGFETFDYGNFNDAFGPGVNVDTAHRGWSTYDHRPRFGTNYYGLRGRVAVLSEAYSHDPFERRVASTYAFVRQLLSLVAERGGELKARTYTAYWRGGEGSAPSYELPIRSALPATAPAQPVIFEVLARTGDSSRTQPGVPRGIRRTGEMRTRSMPVFDRFVPSLAITMPGAYLVPDDSALLARLAVHGIRAEPIGAARFANVEQFAVDSVQRAPRAFQGHNEVRPFGRWVPFGGTPGGRVVRTDGPLGRLAAYLLDPESDDGLVTWNTFDAALAARRYPVLRASLH